MSISASNRGIWEEIERSESYLVSCMYNEAASVASSVLKDLCNNKFSEDVEEMQLNDMLESAGMVVVQALKELGRTQDILNELLQLFGSITTIPVQVFLTGACFQISEGPCLGTREFLEEFLSKWKFVDEQYHILACAESNAGYVEGSSGNFVLEVDEYLEVVEIYVITLLGMALRDIDLAVSWAEKASLPEEKRQELLRKLQSLYSPKGPGPSQVDVPYSMDEYQTQSSYLEGPKNSKGPEEALKTPYPLRGENDMKQSIIKLSQQRVPCFWWFRTITLKFGNRQLAISNGKFVVGCLMILMYYILQRKKATLKGIVKRQAMSMKKALVDLWQLAFSYQVNPLAAVQPVPAATRGSR